MNLVDFNGIEPVIVTMEHSDLTSDDIGKPVKAASSRTAALCDDGDAFIGKLVQVEEDVCSVQIGGIVTMDYDTDHAPSVNISAMLAGADGKVKVGTSGDPTYKVFAINASDGEIQFWI